MLTNSAFPLHTIYRAEVELTARRLGMTVTPVEVRVPEEIDGAFATIAREKVDGLLMLGQPILFGARERVARLALEQRLPAVVVFGEIAQAGVLMSYGARVIDDFRRLPYYIDSILKGAKPGELPVEQPTRFYLTVNLKTAKAIGLTIPQSLLQRADEVIQWGNASLAGNVRSWPITVSTSKVSGYTGPRSARLVSENANWHHRFHLSPLRTPPGRYRPLSRLAKVAPRSVSDHCTRPRVLSSCVRFGGEASVAPTSSCPLKAEIGVGSPESRMGNCNGLS